MMKMETEHKSSSNVIFPTVVIILLSFISPLLLSLYQRLDLRGHRIRSLNSGMKLSPNLEFVYLRDNMLSSLEGIEILKRVKVLDLSFNDFKGPGFEPLEACKSLQVFCFLRFLFASLNSWCGNVAAMLELDENLNKQFRVFKAAPQKSRGAPAKKPPPDYFL